MDKTFDILNLLAQKLSDVAQKQGPEALHIMLIYLQIHAILNLVFGLVFAAMSVFVYHSAKFDANNVEWKEPTGLGIWCIIRFSIAIVFAMIFFVIFVDSNTWMTAIDGRFGLVQMVLSATRH